MRRMTSKVWMLIYYRNARHLCGFSQLRPFFKFLRHDYCMNVIYYQPKPTESENPFFIDTQGETAY